MTVRSISTAFGRWLALLLCALSLAAAAQATAADLALDARAALAQPVVTALVDADGCAAPVEKGGKAGHCAACCTHHGGQAVPSATAVALPVSTAAGRPRTGDASAPWSLPPSRLPDPPKA